MKISKTQGKYLRALASGDITVHRAWHAHRYQVFMALVVLGLVTVVSDHHDYVGFRLAGATLGTTVDAELARVETMLAR